MNFIILSGMSGSGKNTAFKMLEDFGYFCVDNLPAELFAEFADLVVASPKMEKVALGLDIRGGENIDAVLNMMLQFGKKNLTYKMFFLDASDECLIHRYKESRRKHPLSEGSLSLEESISLERKKLAPLKKRSDYVIDTSHLLTRDLQGTLHDILFSDTDFKSLVVTILTFGYKFGVPEEADYVIDTRFLPNPYYDSSLRYLSGNDPEIQNFCLNNEVAGAFLDRLIGFFKLVIPEFIKTGKNQIVIAVGCTGGRHRSVSVANRLFSALRYDRSFSLNILHRDIEKRK